MSEGVHKWKTSKQSTLPFERIVVPSKNSKVDRFVVDYIIDAIVPLSTVDNNAFKSMISGKYTFD